MYEDLRKAKIYSQELGDNVKALENYIEKYVPLQIQNALSKSLNGYVSPQQKIRLEDYEVKVFSELHDIILKDDGIPNIDEQREEITKEINLKLTYLQEVYQQRHLAFEAEQNQKEEDESDGDANNQDEVVDEEDMVQIFKNQIAKIQQTLEELPYRLRKIEDTVDSKIQYKYDETERHVKVLEAKLTNLYDDLEEHRTKLQRDKRGMKEHVNKFKVEFEAYKQEFIDK